MRLGQESVYGPQCYNILYKKNNGGFKPDIVYISKISNTHRKIIFKARTL